MTQYFAPGVYVEEQPSAVQPIAGVGTSTAAFVGIVPDKVLVPFSRPDLVTDIEPTVENGKYLLRQYPVVTDPGTCVVRVIDTTVTVSNEGTQVTLSQNAPAGAVVFGDYIGTLSKTISGKEVKDCQYKFPSKHSVVAGKINGTMTVAGQSSDISFDIVYDSQKQEATVTFGEDLPENASVIFSYHIQVSDEPFEKLVSPKTGPFTPSFKPVVTEDSFNRFGYIDPNPTIENVHTDQKALVTLSSLPPTNAKIECDYRGPIITVKNEPIGTWNGKVRTFRLNHYPVVEEPSTFRLGTLTTQATPKNDTDNKTSSVIFADAISAPARSRIMATYQASCVFEPVDATVVKLCTNFSEFEKFFGGFSTDPGLNRLAHAVNGFFLNGGARCYVMRVKNEADINPEMLKRGFAPIDEIAIVATPGITSAHQVIVEHCATVQDRFAVLDSAETIEDESSHEFSVAKLQTLGSNNVPTRSDYAAFYAPWIQVNDPASQVLYPEREQKEKWCIAVPPSGHIAGIYARVDNNRGVHKAPANETIRGALRVKYRISHAQQEGINPIGVNCIRDMNGSILVWGARTIGGDDNREWKYINVRRLFLFLRESIDEGTQWVVFEPNTPDLWAKITRNITAFLTTVWRSGALFGATPQEAFYVKCDAELNPREERDLGRVWTEIGVAVAKPAEFVIFRISQWAGPGG